jgi:hypothetical protein
MIKIVSETIVLSDETKPYLTYLQEVEDHNSKALKGNPDVASTKSIQNDALANAANPPPSKPRFDNKGKDMVVYQCGKCHQITFSDHQARSSRWVE